MSARIPSYLNLRTKRQIRKYSESRKWGWKQKTSVKKLWNKTGSYSCLLYGEFAWVFLTCYSSFTGLDNFYKVLGWFWTDSGSVLKNMHNRSTYKPEGVAWRTLTRRIILKIRVFGSAVGAKVAIWMSHLIVKFNTKHG